MVAGAAVTSGGGVAVPCATAKPHDVLALTGGAIGIGGPLAIGAAVAKPDSKVVSLNGDGSAMYSLQALWTAVQRKLPLTVVVINNSGNQLKAVSPSGAMLKLLKENGVGLV